MVTTGGRNDAERLGEALVVERLAACCSVMPTVHSFYYWDGQLKREHESLLLVKTLESRRDGGPGVRSRATTTYELPGDPPDRRSRAGASAYLKWLADQVAEPGL